MLCFARSGAGIPQTMGGMFGGIPGMVGMDGMNGMADPWGIPYGASWGLLYGHVLTAHMQAMGQMPAYRCGLPPFRAAQMPLASYVSASNDPVAAVPIAADAGAQCGQRYSMSITPHQNTAPKLVFPFGQLTITWQTPPSSNPGNS